MRNRLITENALDSWVAADSQKAQGLIVELVYRLVAAACPNPQQRRFPLGDSIGQHGPDGFLETEIGFPPFIPKGISYWEIGTNKKAGDKATEDYSGLTSSISIEIRQQCTFVFVTPRSGRTDWEYTWKENAQVDWRRKRKTKNEWLDVRVIDGTQLIDWLQHFPAVELWLAKVMGLSSQHLTTPEQFWSDLKTVGEPPPLIPDVFLVNREKACEKLQEIFSGSPQISELKLDTYYPAQMVNFITAFLAVIEEKEEICKKLQEILSASPIILQLKVGRYYSTQIIEVVLKFLAIIENDVNIDNIDFIGTLSNCIIVSHIDAWNEIINLRQRQILVANFDLDYNTGHSSVSLLLQKARRMGHIVIYGGMPGGIPHPNSITIPEPKAHQVEDVLKKAGYSRQRARTLAQKSNGNLTSLLRCIQNLSLMPEWAQRTDSAELAIAALLGSWTESEEDKASVEKLAGKAYGKWIEKMRDVALCQDTPLSQRDGRWKFVMRYEGWYALGSRLFNDHLERFKNIAIDVLGEHDPSFDLPSEQRYAANIYGKVLKHSYFLRNGIAEGVALLGSHGKELINCYSGKAETVASLIVRELLNDAEWIVWASLDRFLPLLAEASPNEFLNALESGLNSNPSPFDMIFSQEIPGSTGRTYLSGLLWALETLAWDTDYLTRVVIILGELTARDPGGSWGNRPINSLITIFLPWFPQTCASIEKRKSAITTLIQEHSEVAWKLLLALFPSQHQSSMGSRKPAWREIIPDTWLEGVTHQDYRDQILIYIELALTIAKKDTSKLIELVDRIPDIPFPIYNQFLGYLRSDCVIYLSEETRFALWTKLVDLVTKHRKFKEAKWAMKLEQVDEIDVIAKSLAPDAPIFRYQRLFNKGEFDFFEDKGDYKQQNKKLTELRKKAIEDIFLSGQLELILKFTQLILQPWQVGIIFGEILDELSNLNHEIELEILPKLLESEFDYLAQFAGSFIWGWFRKKGWEWMDQIETSSWTPTQIGKFLSFLPFTSNNWERVKKLLSEDESLYWSQVNVNPYQIEDGFDFAIDRLLKYNRPHDAIECLQKMLHDDQVLDVQQLLSVLRALLNHQENTRKMDVYAVVEIIKWLQNNPDVDTNDVYQIEWAFLMIFDDSYDIFPSFLEQKLADEPEFFCEMVQTVFRSNKKENIFKEPTENQKNIATNAYELLHKWRTPPGNKKNGQYDGQKFIEWLEKVKDICSESGHLEVALSMVSNVLVYVPSDPDGLWIHRSVAEALNAKDAKELREGFVNKLFNSRGAYFVDPTGEAERKIAKKYRTQAEEVELQGYYRLATSLKELASSYDRQAEQDILNDHFDF